MAKLRMPTVLLPTGDACTRDELVALWAQLGIAFAVSRPSAAIDPERLLLASLPHMAQDRKLLRLVTTWLGDFGELIHLERLLGLVKSRPASLGSGAMVEARLLGGLARTAVASGDRRWLKLAERCKKALAEGAPEEASQEGSATFLVTRDGADLHFFEFGLTVASLTGQQRPGFESNPSKKLLTRETIVAENPWLRLRVALGTNWRADLVFAVLAGLAANPFQAARLLGCSYETAHRTWRSCEGAKVHELFNTQALFASAY